jgi:hypothetical protein
MVEESSDHPPHAIVVETDSATGLTRLTCTCGETASGRLVDVLEV